MNESSLVHEQLSDHELLAEVTRLTASERQATSRLVSALAELDARRLYLGQGCSSMFKYCTQVLHLAEHAAYNRIEAARAARRFPAILTLLADGRIHLSAIRLLAPHFTEANHRDVLREASYKTKREIEHLVARLQPRPDVVASVRKVPVPHTSAVPSPAPSQTGEVVPEALPASTTVDSKPRSHVEPVCLADATMARPKLEPLAPGRYKVQFTLTQDTYDKLRRVQDLLRHRLPTGDPGAIFDRALTLLLEDLERKKIAAAHRPRAVPATAKRSRHVPAAVRRVVWARERGRRAKPSAGGNSARRKGASRKM
jgi:hypothetical protein